MSPKAICLVVVSDGVADAVHPEHVECQIIDFDNIEAGDPPVELPRGVGYEALVREADLKEGEGFVWAPEPYQIWEYVAKVKGDPIRWIAARSPEIANKAARRRGWRPCGPVPIYGMQHGVPQDETGLTDIGCDVVVS